MTVLENSLKFFDKQNHKLKSEVKKHKDKEESLQKYIKDIL